MRVQAEDGERQKLCGVVCGTLCGWWLITSEYVAALANRERKRPEQNRGTSPVADARGSLG